MTGPDGERPVIAVVGPTATGKTGLAVALAQALGGEVVNADPQLFYRGMDIGTAKPTAEERRGIPHHRIDTLDVGQEASVARYQREARGDIESIVARGRRVVVVGGSGLYLRALLDRLDIPPTDPAIRGSLEARAALEGAEALHLELARVDPEAAARIPSSNLRRLVRALEVVALTGSYSASLPDRRYHHPTVQIGLGLDMGTLDRLIGERTQRMWDGGLLEETERLLEAGLREGKTASKAVGYAEAIRVVDGGLGREEAVEATVTRTRKLARRQARWFRPDPRIHWIDGASSPGDQVRATTEALRILGTVDP